MPCTVSRNALRDIQILSRFGAWAELSEDVGFRLVILMEPEHGQQFKVENTLWGTSHFAFIISFDFNV